MDVIQRASTRPTRKGAGQRKSDPHYVNSIEVIQDALGDLLDENKELLNTGRGRGRKRKRVRSPSPVAHPLVAFDVVNEANFTSLDISPSPVSPGPEVEPAGFEPISLTFNIPLGFTGPLKVEIDPTQMLRRPTPPLSQKPHYVVEPPIKRRRLEQAKFGGKTGLQARKMTKWVKRYGQPPRGFLDLPAGTSIKSAIRARANRKELRNVIYRLVFVSEAPIDFSLPTNCQRSAALLQTCKQVHEEGVSTLYSENRFIFHRNRQSRVPFWVQDSREIGYLDMRHFLTMIGESGRGFLRRFHIVLEDANKVQISQLDSEARFTHDANLLTCFKIMARDCYLKTLALTFQGKRKVSTTDVRFLETLSAVEVDNVIFNPSALWSGDRFEARVRDILQKEMIRPEPLYEDDHLSKSEHFCHFRCHRYW